MSRSKKSLKNLIFAMVGQGFGLIISFIARFIFIKKLGADYLGLNGLFTNILTVLCLAELGVGEAITYSLYKPLAEKDYLKCQMLMHLYKRIYIIIGFVILFIGVIITPILPFFISDMPDISHINLIYILFVINTSVSYFFSYKRNLIIADQNRYIATFYRYLFFFILNFFQIILLIISKNYLGFLILQIINTFLENIFISIKANKMYPFLMSKCTSSLDIGTKKSIFKNTKAMLMHKIGGVIVNSTDNILLSTYVGLTSVALYSNYYLIINALHTIIGQIFSSISASVGNLFAKENIDYQYDVFKKIYFVNFWIYSFSSVCLICISNPFIKIWIGESYLFPIRIVIVLVINFYLTGMRKSVLVFREAAGLFYKDRWKAIIEAVVNLMVSIVLAVKYGTIGVFLGTLISSVTVCVWIEPYVLYKYGFGIKLIEYFKIYFKYFIITLLLSFITYFVCTFVNCNMYLSFVIKSMLCIIIPNLFFFIVFHKSNEFKYFSKLLFGKLFKKHNKSTI